MPIVDDVADDVTDRTAHFDFANDGTLVYLSRDAVTSDRTIAWMDPSGQVEKLLEAPGRYTYLFPSPDGRKLAFVSGQDIWVLDVKRAGHPACPSTPSGINGRCGHPTVRTSCSAHRTGAAPAARSGGFARMAPKNRRSSSRASMNCIPHRSRRMAHTWRSIGAARKRCTTSGCYPSIARIRSVRKQGTLEVFLRTPVNEWGGVFSPNGRWVAYYSEESGTGEIYVRPFRGRGGPWLVSSGGIAGRLAHWPSGGRALYYLSTDRHIMEVTYTEEGNSFVADEPQRWSEATLPFAAFNVSPDTTRAIIAAPAEPLDARHSLHVTFLLNVFDELRRRAPAAVQ